MKKKISIIIIVLLIAIQFIPIKKNKSVNAFSETDFIVINKQQDQKIGKLIVSSCYDCHSNNTTYPWYDNIAPISWYLSRHVNEAKEHLNFSEWGIYETKKQDHKIEECIELLEAKEMPLKTYTFLHKEAKLSEEENELLIQYFKSL